MSIGKLGRAAAAAIAIGTAGCDLENEYDGEETDAPAAACEPCARPFELKVNTMEGGRVECAGGVAGEFPEATTVKGLCADTGGFAFRVVTDGVAEYTTFDKDGKPVTVEFDLSGDDLDAVLGSKFRAPNGGTVQVKIPE